MLYVEWSNDLKAKLNIAFNEATWLGLRLDEQERAVALGFSVLTLPEAGPEPENPMVTLLLQPVGRIAASLRNGLWNDENATVETLSPDEMPGVVESFGGLPIYGWEFFDPPETDWEHWRDRLSLDVRWSPESQTHVIDLFQEGGSGNPRHLDLRVWFDELRMFDASGTPLEAEEFAEGGKRWWDGFYENDPRTHGHGMAPM